MDGDQADLPALVRRGAATPRFYALPVRPPTVPEGTSRIRFSLTAAVRREEVEQLARLIRDSEQPPFPLNHSEK